MKFSTLATRYTALLLLGLSLIVAAILLFVFFPKLTPERSQKLYEEGQHSCGSEVWFIVEDIGPVLIYKAAPFPASFNEGVGEHIIDFKCTESEAIKIQEQARKSGWNSLVLLLLIPVSALAGSVLVIIWLLFMIYRKIRNNSLVKKL